MYDENIVPDNAICEICHQPIGMERACKVYEIDEDTNEPIGNAVWFHEACLRAQ